MSLGLLGELIVGGIKVKDGLFIGDQYAAQVGVREQDSEFIFVNKITHIINCASRDVPNFFAGQGIEYLSIPWEENDGQTLFDLNGQTLNAIVGFVDQAGLKAESVLVHSLKGQSRASCAICAYLMVRYRWGFYKTLEFMDSRRPDLEIRRNFFEQLKFLAERLASNNAVSETWDQSCATRPEVKAEEQVLMNTFLNSRLEDRPAAEHKKSLLKPKKKKPAPAEKKKKKIRWIDEAAKNSSLETGVFGANPRGPKLTFNPGMSPQRSILKAADKDSSDLAVQPEPKKQTKRPESSSLKRNDHSGAKPALIGPATGERPKSSQLRKSHEDASDDSDIGAILEQKGAIRRLLNEEKRPSGPSFLDKSLKNKPPLGLAQSNSFRKLDEVKAKRGETPRKRDLSEKDKRKPTDSCNKSRDEPSATSYTKPPTTKKPTDPRKPNDSMLQRREPLRVESLLADSGMKLTAKEDSDGQYSANKKLNRSDLDDKDQVNTNNSKNRYASLTKH